jgi:hypothetical protein
MNAGDRCRLVERQGGSTKLFRRTRAYFLSIAVAAALLSGAGEDWEDWWVLVGTGGRTGVNRVSVCYG